MRIVEVPIPTYYGDEICYVDGMSYAAEVTRDVITYRLQKAGFGDGSRIALSEEYELKPSEDSSHGRITKLLQSRTESRILDLGCSSGLLSERLRRMGHHVVGVDVNDIDGVRDRTDVFFKADLNDGIPAEVGSNFDIVLAADVLEHVVNPGVLMCSGQRVSGSEWDRVRSACPDIAHWYPRFRRPSGCSTTTSGDPRLYAPTVLHPAQPGQADSTSWFAIRRIEPVGLPLDALGVESDEPARSGSWIACCPTCGRQCSDTSLLSKRHL